MGFLRTIKQGFTGYRDLRAYNAKKGLSVQQKSPGTYTAEAKPEEKQVQRYAGAAVQASGGTKPRPTIQSLSQRQYPKAQYKSRIGFFRA